MRNMVARCFHIILGLIRGRLGLAKSSEAELRLTFFAPKPLVNIQHRAMDFMRAAPAYLLTTDRSAYVVVQTTFADLDCSSDGGGQHGGQGSNNSGCARSW